MMSRTMMMTNERKIWEAALLLVRRHGEAAAEIARKEAQRLRRGDDELTCVVWCWIARSTAELLRPVPSKGERVH
jgi:predicted secreted Zn-dependent protease